MTPRLFFFIGKGGVGKSTTSAVTAMHLAEGGLKTLLVSMDPAHNQCDIFERPFREKPTVVTANLSVKEVDIDFWIKAYLKETKTHLKHTYRYQSAYNLDRCFNVLQFSPGLEEHAMVQAFESILQRAKPMDALIFDMPPTALTLRFFSLPAITLVWLRELLHLRNRIIEKKEIISRIKVGNRQIEQDKVKAKLSELIGGYQKVADLFHTDAVGVYLVVNDDRLSCSEGMRIREKLADLGLPVCRVIVNKLTGAQRIPADLKKVFKTQTIVSLPFAQGGLSGIDRLRTYAQSNWQRLAAVQPVNSAGRPAA